VSRTLACVISRRISLSLGQAPCERSQPRFTAATCSVKQGAVDTGGGAHNASGLICESEPM
jgi:hypothetical protein